MLSVISVSFVRSGFREGIICCVSEGAESKGILNILWKANGKLCACVKHEINNFHAAFDLDKTSLKIIFVPPLIFAKHNTHT